MHALQPQKTAVACWLWVCQALRAHRRTPLHIQRRVPSLQNIPIGKSYTPGRNSWYTPGHDVAGGGRSASIVRWRCSQDYPAGPPTRSLRIDQADHRDYTHIKHPQRLPTHCARDSPTHSRTDLSYLFPCPQIFAPKVARAAPRILCRGESAITVVRRGYL